MTLCLLVMIVTLVDSIQMDITGVRFNRLNAENFCPEESKLSSMYLVFYLCNYRWIDINSRQLRNGMRGLMKLDNITKVERKFCNVLSAMMQCTRLFGQQLSAFVLSEFQVNSQKSLKNHYITKASINF